MTVALPFGFAVRLNLAQGETFQGTLSELAAALRAGRVLPPEVPLLLLTRELLAWAYEQTGTNKAAFADAHPDLLPTLANVIALKARLLLPKPEEPEPEAEQEFESELEELIDGVEALAELDALVAFLAARRREREGLIPAQAVPIDLPRRERARNPKSSLEKLLKAAQQAVRQIDAPLLSRERLTLADALRALKTFGKRLKSFTFRGIPAQGWGERTTYFAALLEGVKEGAFSVQQEEIYGDIEVKILKEAGG